MIKVKVLLQIPSLYETKVGIPATSSASLPLNRREELITLFLGHVLVHAASTWAVRNGKRALHKLR